VYGWRRFALGSVAIVAAVAGTAACGAASDAASPGSPSTSHTIRVVAAESFWGSIASQLGGPHVHVRSLIRSPDADPHDYEPTAADARAIASADLVLVNGVGYDTWASKLPEVDPTRHRMILDVGQVLRVPNGGNPHRWHKPDDVTKVADQLTRDYSKADPADAAAFASQSATFQNQTLADYLEAIAGINDRYGGTPVGSSESIFAMLAPALGLELLTPPPFLKTISEGVDPTAADKAMIDHQISEKKIKVYVYNPQNATPDVQGQVNGATAAGVPVTTMTETLVPPNGTWQEWQTRQLGALRDALAKATGR
jgi:zinc/manganese transport system substrate-binding protein